MLKTKRFWLGLGLVVISMAIALRGIEFDRLFQAIASINLIYVLPAIILFWLSFGGRAFRWQLLYSPLHVRLSKVLAMLSIGYFLSNIAPLRAGDVVRAYLLARSERVPVARSLSSVVVERVMDLMTVVLLLVVLLPFIPRMPEAARAAGTVMGAAGLVLLVAFALLSLNRERALPLLRRLSSPFPLLKRESIWHAIDRLVDGFAVLHSLRPLAGVIAWSILIWITAGLINWMALMAMGIPLGPTAALLVLVATSLGVTIAPTPGQLGVFDATAQQTLVLVYNVDPARALAYALVIHAYIYVWLMILGGLFMWREGISYGQLQRVENSPGSPGATPIVSG